MLKKQKYHLHKVLENQHREFLENKYLNLLSRIRTRKDERKTAKVLAREQIRLEKIAMKDRLTGAYNRAYLEETLPREIKEARILKTPLSILMIDCDFLKKVNDEEPDGHQAGDRTLCGLVRIIETGIRKSRLPGFTARYGGEEWTLVLNNLEAKALGDFAEGLRCKVEENLAKAARLITRDKVTISLGGYVISGKETMEGALGKADKALYEAKKERNTYRSYNGLPVQSNRKTKTS